MMRSGIFAAALFFGLIGCNSGGGSGNLAVPAGTYDLSFEGGSCGVLKTSSPMRYEWDAGCDGSIDYSNSNVTRVGSRYFVEAGSLKVTAVNEAGFEGVFSLQGDTTPVSATLQSGES